MLWLSLAFLILLDAYFHSLKKISDLEHIVEVAIRALKEDKK